MLTPDQYCPLAARVQVFDHWVDSVRNPKTGVASYRPEDIPEVLRPAPTNEERSAVAVFEFCRDLPERYMAYFDDATRTITTWTGNLLSATRVAVTSRAGRCPRRRVYFRFRAINGIAYRGITYPDAGTYCRLYALKDQS